MINAVYREKPLIFIGATFQEKLGSEYKLLNTLKFIKAVSDTVSDMINAVYHEKSLIFIGATFQKKLVSHHRSWFLPTIFQCFNLAFALKL